MLMAGPMVSRTRSSRPRPWIKISTKCPPKRRRNIAQTPGTLEESLNALERDHQFLLKGGVFSADLIETYIEYKREQEFKQIALRPHPFEFMLYYDI